MKTKYSNRWHATHEGRTLIVYADTKHEAQSIIQRHTNSVDFASKTTESGYYDEHTNLVMNAGDGPTERYENWEAGRAKR